MAQGDPDRYALLGHPVSHSWSPFIHGLFARQLGHDIDYRLIDVAPEQFRARYSTSSSMVAAA
jgi:shikimate 5-dehydrogenase